MSLRGQLIAHSVATIDYLPDLDNPRGYNDIIQWLKLHDQRPEQVQACDKIAVRKMVADLGFGDYLIPAFAGWPPTHFPVVAKCNHDSGSAKRLTGPEDVVRLQEFFAKRLLKPFGVKTAEWAYQKITPQILVEDMLPEPIVDFKFHCGHGKIRWVQVIWDRAIKPREAIFFPDGRVTSLHMDHKMIHDPNGAPYPGEVAWKELSRFAEALAEMWRYVRVDLYWCEQPWFGEMTFWPKAGCYASPDEPTFGKMLDLDLSYRLPPIMQ